MCWSLYAPTSSALLVVSNSNIRHRDGYHKKVEENVVHKPQLRSLESLPLLVRSTGAVCVAPLPSLPLNLPLNTPTTCSPRQQVAEKYRKKIELMVRKPEHRAGAAGGAGVEDPQPGLVPCVFCGLPGPETDLQCVSCHGIIPYDIASGEW